MLLSLLERSAQYGQLCPLLLRLLTDASHSLFLLTALPALDASQIAAGVYDNWQYRPIFFLAVFRAYLPYKLPVLPPEYFVGPNCYVLRYAREIFSWVPNLHKRRISQPVLGFDITVRASAFTGAGVGINARLPDMALYTSPVCFSFRAKNDITRPQRKTSCSNGRGVFAIS